MSENLSLAYRHGWGRCGWSPCPRRPLALFAPLASILGDGTTRRPSPTFVEENLPYLATRLPSSCGQRPPDFEAGDVGTAQGRVEVGPLAHSSFPFPSSLFQS